MATRAQLLDDLDSALEGVRRLWSRAALHRWFAAELGHAVELATVRTLRAVETAGPRATVGEVALALDVAASTATRMVDRAIDDGLLVRAPSREDGRRRELSLTDLGRTVLDQSTQVRRWGLEAATSGWPAEDLELLARLLARLRQGFDDPDHPSRSDSP